MINFIESKQPNMDRIGALLDLCRQKNQWANRGPLYELLIDKYTALFKLDSQRTVTPSANGGIALEAMSRLLGQRAGKPMRWIASAFSFQNLGRGHFSNITFVDCTPQGLLNLDEVHALPEESFDGLIVVNPFGLSIDFRTYIDYARTTGKALLIDNAAGVNDYIPDWPWQAFSLHHTKPYGMGEGGLALTPANAAEEFYALLNYGPPPERAADWLNNGKISDIACAFLIDRLERADHWVPLYREQAERVHSIARQAGLTPIRPFGPTAPAMSWAFTAERAIPLSCIHQTQRLRFAKYYKPLRQLPVARDIFARLLNIPTHPDVARLTDTELLAELEIILDASATSKGSNALSWLATQT